MGLNSWTSNHNMLYIKRPLMTTTPLQASQTRQPRMSTTSLRIALTTQLPKATNVSPDDYHTTAGLTDKATTNVDNVFENCADYTATQGYECVPYYQCHNGTIITDGGGLIDIRNGL